MSLVVTLKQNVGVTVSSRTVKITLGRRGPQGPPGPGGGGSSSWVVDYFGAFGPGYDILVPAGVFGPLPWGPDYFLYQTPWGEYLTAQATNGQTIGCADYRDALGNAVPANERLWTLTGGSWVIDVDQPLPGQPIVLNDWTPYGQWALGITMILTGDGRMEELNLQHDRAAFAHTSGLVFADSDGFDGSLGGVPVGTTLVDATIAPVTRTLDNLATPGREVVIVKTDVSGNRVKVAPSPGQTIRGSTNPVELFSQWDYVRLILSGTDWVPAGERSAAESSAYRASAILWTPAISPAPGSDVHMLWWWPDPTRIPTPGVNAPEWYVVNTWSLPPVWQVDPDDYVLLVVGNGYFPSVYARVTPEGFVPIDLPGGATVSVSCDTYGGPTVWVGRNDDNPATNGTLVTTLATEFVPQTTASTNVLLSGGYTGNLSGSWTAAQAFDYLDALVGPSVTVGTTTTGAPGTFASVVNSGDPVNVVLDFTIPRGDKGDPGDPSAISALTGEPMGHPSLTASSFSFDNTSRTYTIQPTGASFDVWVRGVKFTKSTPQSVSVPNLSDLYFITFDVTGTLVQSTSFFDLENCAPTAAVYWNATTGQAELVFDERHGVVMDWRTHEYLHLTRGAAMASGFDLSGYTLGGAGNVDADAQVAVADGVFYDEDIRVHPVNAASPTPWTWEQRLAFPAEVPVFYRTGTDEFVLDPATTFPVKQGTARIRYNQLTGGSWTTTDIANNRYGITWVVATNNVNYPIIGILGQAEYSSLPTAQAVTWNSLNLTGLPIAEMRPLWKLVFQTATGMGNTPHASLASVTDLRAIVPLLIS